MKNKTLNTRKISAIVLALVLVCSVSAGYAYAAGTPNLIYASAGRTPGTAAEVYAQNVNSTVAITTSAVMNYFGYDTLSGGSGSGFIITDDGYILTNYHVVEGAEKITVETYGGDKYTAELIGYDESNDIAVLKVDAKNMTPVVFGDSDKIAVGEDVVAAGGLIIQIMPDCSEVALKSIEMSAPMFMNISKTFAEYGLNGTMEQLLGHLEPEIIGTARPAYRCDCTRERFERGLISLGREELTTLIEEDHGAEVNCHFCNRSYRFSEKQLRDLLARAQS